MFPQLALLGTCNGLKVRQTKQKLVQWPGSATDNSMYPHLAVLAKCDGMFDNKGVLCSPGHFYDHGAQFV